MDKALWARFGEAAVTAPHALQWLSDNGPQYTATASVLYAHALGLVPITTPALQPREQWARRGLRQHVQARLRRAAPSSAMPNPCSPSSPSWFDDYNRQAPHSALGMRPPAEYRASLELTPPSV